MKRLPRHALPFAAPLLIALAPVLPASPPDAEEPWRIEDAHGPVRTVAFTTDEGTWLHLDVHPDGRRIVFSLLGDLYVLPREGGRAARITSGPAYDVQPRFSPDGTRIAFASDRDGLENLWVCDLDGKNPRQVSKEKACTVSAPAWSPDGEWILGRKRLTDTSSIGLVELWMYHVRGGDGVQLTKKEEQSDAADAAFSRDGRFVYFAGRDGRFRYDANVNDGIWQVKRLDRRTGQILPVTGEFGGAGAPALSPDGRSLAFVRRVRARTRLEVMDLVTGATRTLATDVERDNQEGFCFHGVFPGYAWTPDGTSIVATSEGRIWAWDVATGARTAVPFTAAVEQTVTEALRTARRVGEGPVRARIIRWPVESPDGKSLVFSAVGHLYVMDLPAGKPRRLTDLDDLEYAPAFSPDGRLIAFVTWNDDTGGRVWTMPSAGGAPRAVTDIPAQYVNPAFSRDGRWLVFVKGSGATFRDEDLGDELWGEIHVAPASGGPSRFVIGVKNRGQNRRMARPAFSADGERIWYVENGDPATPGMSPRTVLMSVKVDGTDRRAHLRFSRAEEVAVSPDEKWVVFNELHNAWIAPLPQESAQPVDVSLEGGSLPTTQLTAEGGEWVAWADGGRTATWIYGPVYRRLPLARAYPEPDEPAKKKAPKDEERPEPKKLPSADAVEIDLEVERARPHGTVAYRGARLVTMKGDEVVERGTIVVDGDRIAAVGPDDRVRVPAGAQVVDVSGRTVIPGLFDEHAHLHYSTLDIFPRRPWKYLANLAYGVTSTHDPSASTQEVFAQSEMVEAGLMTGPRIFSTGFILYGADDPGKAEIKSLEDARGHLRRMKSLGAFSVKSYMQPRRDARQWILKAAREEGMLVVPEGGGDLEMDMSMILDGHTTVEHALPVTPLRKDVVTLFGRSGTAYAPTLLVAYGGIMGDRWFYQHYDVWKDDKLLRYVPQRAVDVPGRIRSVMATDEDWHHLDVAASAKRVLGAGGHVVLGGHGQMQGLGPHWEIWAFVQGGMAPIEALRVATIEPARALGMDRDLGSLEPGKLADFVVLDRNPLETIENTDSVRLVVKNGRAYTPEELERRR